MTARVQLVTDVYMPLDGQWQIVLSGSVIDVPTAVTLTAAHYTPVAETPKSQASTVSFPLSVRSIRTK